MCEGKTMERRNVDRIDVLEKKSRTPGGLTEEGRQGQAALRREYIDSFKRSLCMKLDNTYLVDEKGNKRKLMKLQ